jgi:hypothetical protein
MSLDVRICVGSEKGLTVCKVEAVTDAFPVTLFSPGAAFAVILPFRSFG